MYARIEIERGKKNVAGAEKDEMKWKWDNDRFSFQSTSVAYNQLRLNDLT